MKQLLVVSVLSLAAQFAPGEAQAQSSAPPCSMISSLPVVINEPGNYCMAVNATVNITTGQAILIDANDVTLDCQNYTLTNEAASATGSSAGIRATNRHNLLIRNCRVMGGFTDGIHVHMPFNGPTTSYYNRIENNYVGGPYRYGILGIGSAIEIRNNQVYDVGGQENSAAFGIRIGGSSVSGFKFQVVENNIIAGTNSPSNNAYGIYSDSSIGSMFLSNRISGTYGMLPNYRGTGIRIAVGDANTLRDNIINGGGRANEIGIQTVTNGGVCFDNQIRVSLNPTVGCIATHGNY